MNKSQNTMTWGAAPTTTCMKLWEFAEPENYKDVLVWGVGDGRNVIFLAGQGYNVTAIDPSESAIEKVDTWAKEAGININSRVESELSKNLGGPFDIIISVGMINLIPKEQREDILGNLQSITNPNGLNAVSAFIEKPFIKNNSNPVLKSGELLGFYHSWKVHWVTQSLFKSDDSVHCVDRLIAERMGDGEFVTPENISQNLQLI